MKGRMVEDIQFRVQLKAQASLLETGAAIVIDSSIIERMLRLGISEADGREGSCDGVRKDAGVRYLACRRPRGGP